MIKDGLCKPLIVVTPCYYAQVEGYEIGDEPDNAQNVWPVYFGQELRNNIIPAVESVYSSYAGGDVSEANLIATRDHRAFAGLSRGSMTVARSGLMDNADLFAYFGNYSGIWAEFAAFKEALTGKFADYEIKFWYNGNGRGDFALENHQAFKDQVLSEMSDRFADGESFAWILLDHGACSRCGHGGRTYNREPRRIDRIFEGSLIYGRGFPDYSNTTSAVVSLFIPRSKPDAQLTKMIAEEHNRLGRPLPINTLLVLNMLRDSPRSDVKQLSEALNLSETMIKAILDRAIETGLVEGFGAGRGRNYSLFHELYQDKEKMSSQRGGQLLVRNPYGHQKCGRKKVRQGTRKKGKKMPGAVAAQRFRAQTQNREQQEKTT